MGVEDAKAHLTQETLRHVDEMAQSQRNDGLTVGGFIADAEAIRVLLTAYAVQAADSQRLDLLQRMVYHRERSHHWAAGESDSVGIGDVVLAGGFVEGSEVTVYLGNPQTPVAEASASTLRDAIDKFAVNLSAALSGKENTPS